MKNLFCIILIVTISSSANAQITITQSDLPQAGDNFILSNAFADLTIDPEQTGANYSWNFGDVTAITSRADTFYNQSGLPIIYQLFFFGANLADKSATSISFSQITLEDVYQVFKSSASQFEQYGYAGTFSGVPLPIVYNSKDVIYHLPLHYGDVDSSDSDFEFELPGLIYFSQNRHRVNKVDGWGTITTPIGIFNALRVKSTITDEDSIYVDTLGLGTNVAVKSYEYKWLAAGEGLPVFQINAEDLFGIPVITQVIYQDTSFHTGVNEITANLNSVATLFPNPANQLIQIQIIKEIKHPLPITVSTASGKIFYHGTVTENLSFIDVSEWSNGLYFLEIIEDGIIHHLKLVVQH
jgi:hypothetical protein